MCGVAAIHAYHYAASPLDRDELRMMQARLASRGPDGSGEWFDAGGRVGIAHTRLAIIDTGARAAQPMIAADASAVIGFNGEIYNFRALRAELARSGVQFRTESDTEVLLATYARYGERMFDALRGMYAFALWDARRGAMLLARDPYGIKPLYLADDGWTVRIASQVKALRAGGRVSSTIEPAGLVGFALFGSVPEPFTLLQEVRSVPAGHFIWVDECGPRLAVRHFSIAECFRDFETPAADPAGVALAAVRNSLDAHLIADVPVGAFLSAGVDSSAIVGAMAEASDVPVHAVTVAFDAFRGSSADEAPLAGEIAARYGVEHHVRWVAEAEFRLDLPRIIDAMDQPSIDGVNTWFAAKAASEIGLKVAMSGIGGDELCGGYESFRDLPRWVARLRLPGRIPLLGRAVRSALVPLLAHQRGISPKAAGMLEFGASWPGAWLLRRAVFMPWELDRVLPREVVVEGLRRLDWRATLEASLQPEPNSDFGRVAALEANHYLRNQLLRDTDWASMAHSLEVRTPLVDSWLLRHAGAAFAALGTAGGKRLLAQVPRRALPAAVLARPKTGFQTPAADWMASAGLHSPNWTPRSGPDSAGRRSRDLAAALLSTAV